MVGIDYFRHCHHYNLQKIDDYQMKTLLYIYLPIFRSHRSMYGIHPPLKHRYSVGRQVYRARTRFFMKSHIHEDSDPLTTKS